MTVSRFKHNCREQDIGLAIMGLSARRKPLADEFISESQLQRWFEAAVDGKRLADAIQNVAALDERLARLNATAKVTDRVAREGLANALDICQHLLEVEPLSANESIAPHGRNQMRPDLVLHTSSANYVLVELKTRPGPERQGIQELLAYSAALKMAMPYVNETLYIIVASTWDTLLEHGTRALILDGKRVLPLTWTGPIAGEFELNVRLNLFEFDFVRPYDPFFAMSAATFACTRPVRQGASVSSYFRWHANRVLADCHRIQQCGFLITWTQAGYDKNSEVFSTTLLTLNQHWEESEYLPSDYQRGPSGQQPGILRVIHKQAGHFGKTVTFGSLDNDEADINIFEINHLADERRRRFPQNSIGYEILERRRDRHAEERLCSKDKRIFGFETADYANLKRFLKQLTEIESILVLNFLPFGELQDYALQTNRQMCRDVYDIVDLLYLFREHKGYSDLGPIHA
jgi:hypothetical protein